MVENTGIPGPGPVSCSEKLPSFWGSGTSGRAAAWDSEAGAFPGHILKELERLQSSVSGVIAAAAEAFAIRGKPLLCCPDECWMESEESTMSSLCETDDFWYE